MEPLIKKTLNVLAQIAVADGHLDETEKEVLYEIAREHGKMEVDDDVLNDIILNPLQIEDYRDMSEYDKLEFMYVAIRVMRADGLIHDSEVKFCKDLADQLSLKQAIVDDFSTTEDFSFDSFMKAGKKYII